MKYVRNLYEICRHRKSVGNNQNCVAIKLSICWKYVGNMLEICQDNVYTEIWMRVWPEVSSSKVFFSRLRNKKSKKSFLRNIFPTFFKYVVNMQEFWKYVWNIHVFHTYFIHISYIVTYFPPLKLKKTKMTLVKYVGNLLEICWKYVGNLPAPFREPPGCEDLPAELNWWNFWEMT